MKIFYLFFFYLLISCNGIKKNYVCGDRPCVDKKEFNEYFAKTLSIEIKNEQKRKNKNIDLIKLNTKTLSSEEDNNSLSKKNRKLRKKAEKEKLRAEKYRLLEERKIREAERKLNEKKEKKLAKISKSKIKDKILAKNEIDDTISQVKNVVDKPILEEINKNKIVKSPKKNDTVKSRNIKSICNQINDCDIDKIAERLIKKGKDKPFPNISSN